MANKFLSMAKICTDSWLDNLCNSSFNTKRSMLQFVGAYPFILNFKAKGVKEVS